MSFGISKKILLITSALFIFFCVASPFAKNAEAFAPAGPFVPNFDAANYAVNAITAKNTTSENIKESFLDGILNAAAKVVISNITKSIVTWINSGFKGGPAFITDPQRFFTGVADQVAGNFIAGTELGFMCAPFSLDIRLALNLNYNSTFRDRAYCSLSGIVGNAENFAKYTAGDFSQGGWDSWFQISQNKSNNPYGAYLEAQNELSIRTAQGKDIELVKLDWAKGFLSPRECLEQDAQGNCTKEGDIITPGAAVESQLEETLGTGIRQLELADEINEIVGALVGQVAQTVLTQGLSSFGPGGRNEGTIGGTTAPGIPLSLYCSPSARSASVGDNVQWTARVYGGMPGATTYSWSGEQVSGSTNDTVDVSYSTPGIKTASVVVTQGGQNLFQNCDSITIQ